MDKQQGAFRVSIERTFWFESQAVGNDLKGSFFAGCSSWLEEIQDHDPTDDVPLRYRLLTSLTGVTSFLKLSLILRLCL